jgi:hypothetical protein
MNPIEHNFETVNEFYERDLENTGTPGRGRTQSHYIQQFVNHPMLKALLSCEALPINRLCGCCNNNQIAIWHCRDCTVARVLCRGCISQRDMDCPTHQIEVWNGTFFRRAELWEAGLHVVVRHHADRDVCLALSFQIKTREFRLVRNQPAIFRWRPRKNHCLRKTKLQTWILMMMKNSTEFARRLDNMYKCSHDGKENTGENMGETTKNSYENDFDRHNDIEEMPPLTANYILWSTGEPDTTAIHSQTPDALRYDALNNPYI